MDSNIELESLGILRVTKTPPTLKWLTDVEKHFLVQLYLCGDGGMPRKLADKFTKKEPDSMLRLEFHDIVAWEKDKMGRPCALVLTWKGDDMAKFLHHVAIKENNNKVWAGSAK